MFWHSGRVMFLHVHVQVPWGMVTGPDGNLYIAMDDEFEVRLSFTARSTLPPFRKTTLQPVRNVYVAACAFLTFVQPVPYSACSHSARHA